MAKIQMTFTLEDVDTDDPIRAVDDAKDILSSIEGWQVFGEMDPRFEDAVITNVTATIVEK